MVSKMLIRGKTQHLITSLKTSDIEGISLEKLEKTWKDLAASESRIKMMDSLQKIKVGFNDVEYFNLGLIYNAKTINCNNYGEKEDRKVVETAMKFKRKDEIKNRKRIVKEKLEISRKIDRSLEMTNNMKKKIMKHLNMTFVEKKKELDEKYTEKVKHLRKKFEKDEEKELDKVPDEMIGTGFENLTVFDKERYENEVEVTEIEVVKYGEVEIDDEEEAALKLHPKMALPKRLEEGYMNLQMDLSYTKVRWQLKKDDENKEECIGGMEENKEDEQNNAEKRRKIEENEVEEARTRMVYDSEGRIYDERKQRVTDMKECSRVFLPKPLEVTREAQLEMRREAHAKVSEKFRKENCDERGRQQRTLSVKELRGLKKLEKRKNEGEIVVIMTDKSSKLCIMKREDYLKLGEEHVAKDKEITREDVTGIEKVLNQHALTWIKMWRTGQDHNHEDRIRQSKVSKSENRADLYLSYKDHKKVPGKTRPIATGCSSDTLALSNSVSLLVESLANAEVRKHEIISTEDLLFNGKEHDKAVKAMRKEQMERILLKLECEERKSVRTLAHGIVGELVGRA